MIINEMPGGVALNTTTAGAGDILSGKTAYNGEGNLLTGSMTNQGAITTTTSYGGSYTIPAGYHNGSGKVTGGSFSFSGNAAAAQVLSGYTFYGSNGTQQTGSMTNRGTITTTTSYGGSYTIPAGYHSGSGKVTGGTFSFGGNAAVGDVRSGKTFYSNSGTKQTGTLNINASGTNTVNGPINYVANYQHSFYVGKYPRAVVSLTLHGAMYLKTGSYQSDQIYDKTLCIMMPLLLDSEQSFIAAQQGSYTHWMKVGYSSDGYLSWGVLYSSTQLYLYDTATITMGYELGSASMPLVWSGFVQPSTLTNTITIPCGFTPSVCTGLLDFSNSSYGANLSGIAGWSIYAGNQYGTVLYSSQYYGTSTSVIGNLTMAPTTNGVTLTNSLPNYKFFSTTSGGSYIGYRVICVS